MANFPKILANLTAPIPAPYIPPPTTQLSWHQLKPSQRLRVVGPCLAMLGTTLEVDSTDSQGCWLRLVEGGWVDRLPEFGDLWRWTEPHWALTFERVKGRRPKKPIDTPTEPE